MSRIIDRDFARFIGMRRAIQPSEEPAQAGQEGQYAPTVPFYISVRSFHPILARMRLRKRLAKINATFPAGLYPYIAVRRAPELEELLYFYRPSLRERWLAFRYPCRIVARFSLVEAGRGYERTMELAQRAASLGVEFSPSTAEQMTLSPDVAERLSR